MKAMPTAAQERWMAVRALVPKSDLIEERCGGWRTSSLIARCGFFLLAALSAGALFGLVAAMFDSGRAGAFAAGILSLATAEYLILRFRFFGAGIEEALWLGGALSLAGGMAWDAHGDSVIVALALAVLLAGVRLLNPLFVAAAPVLMTFYLIERTSHASAALVCATVGVAALALLPIPRLRPSVEHALAALAVAMPLISYVVLKSDHPQVSPVVAAALLVYAAVALVVGLRFRLHAPLIALFPSLGALAWELREVSGLTLEARLIVWGIVTLAAAIIIERLLRSPRNGLTSLQLRDDKLTDVLQLAGAAVITTQATPGPQEPHMQPGGGSFGGAGASGDV